MSSPLILMHPSELAGCCPSCHRAATFALIGVQTWPPSVVARTQLPPQMGLYLCPHCETCVSEVELLKS
jgi:hypothetical protein